MCLLDWVARVADEPGATGASVLDALGVVLSIAFEAFAYAEHGSAWAAANCFRARFEPLEETLRTKWIAQLPALPPPLAH